MYRISIISYQNSYVCFIIHIINIGHKWHTYALYVTANCIRMSDMYHVSNVNHHISNVKINITMHRISVLSIINHIVISCIRSSMKSVSNTIHAYRASASSTAYSTSCVKRHTNISNIIHCVSNITCQVSNYICVKYQTSDFVHAHSLYLHTDIHNFIHYITCIYMLHILCV